MSDHRILLRNRTPPSRCSVCHGALSVGAITCRCGSTTHPECRAALTRCPTLACRPRTLRVIHVQDEPGIDRDSAGYQLVLALALIGCVSLGLLMVLAFAAQCGCTCPDHDPERWHSAR